MSDKTCGTCGRVSDEVVCRFVDDDGCDCVETNCRNDKACDQYQERTDSIESVAVEAVKLLGTCNPVDRYDDFYKDHAEEFTERLKALGVEV
jgi:hypothetical protein